MNTKFLTPYNPQETEGRIYKLWEESGFFNPDNLLGKRTEPFSIVLPPPNVTGVLHLGHAYESALQDTIIRYQRMRGKKTLWIPGTDSAAIATQSKVEKMVQKKEGLSRHELGREKLIEKIEQFAKESEEIILNQVKRMGASLDWSRYAYALDEKRKVAVETAFQRMFEDGLIYRGHRIVNWDPKGQTTISDDEIVHEEKTGKFYYLKYGPFVIGTARPETKFGDKYVVMHPSDKRYAKYKHGEKLELEWINGPVTATVIKDEAIDMEFGTGVMTITPWHDRTDFEIAERHGLEKEQIIDKYGRLLPIAGEFAETKISEAREKIIEKLEKKGLLEKTEENYVHNIATAERTGGLVEPQIMEQWFVAVDKEFKIKNSRIPGIENGSLTTLKKIMRLSVESGAVEMPQEGFRKSYFSWIDNLHDWCISRQIWFGHRIPIWYKRELGGPHQAKHFNQGVLLEKLNMTIQEFRASTEDWQDLPLLPDWAQSGGSQNIQIGPTLLTILKDKALINDEWIRENEIEQAIFLKEEMRCGIEPPERTGWVQEEDVLDTWFSSALWTFSTLGWPEKTRDLDSFHPTSLVSPGYEILPLWISRMILMSGFHLGQVPFKKVMIHGMVRDKQGRKFSKSLDNGVDPIEMIEKYGTDALRLGLLVGTAYGNDVKFDESKIRGYKNFANKLWNIARFILSREKEGEVKKELKEEFDLLAKDVTEDMESYRLHLAAEKIYTYIWHRLADELIEESKDKPEYNASLYYILENSLKLLHPFMPFITEEIWQELDKKNLLMVEPWPA